MDLTLKNKSMRVLALAAFAALTTSSDAYAATYPGSSCQISGSSSGWYFADQLVFSASTAGAFTTVTCPIVRNTTSVVSATISIDDESTTDEVSCYLIGQSLRFGPTVKSGLAFSGRKTLSLTLPSTDSASSIVCRVPATSFSTYYSAIERYNTVE
jgi:catabolite regulation protein CreA